MASSVIKKLPALVSLVVLASCRPARYVPVPSVTVRSDTVEITRTDTFGLAALAARRDSFATHDTVYIKEYVRETVDSAGRVLRTDREREKTLVRRQESYTDLLQSSLGQEKSDALLRTSALREEQKAVPAASSPSVPWKLLAVFSALCALLGACAGWRLRRG